MNDALDQYEESKGTLFEDCFLFEEDHPDVQAELSRRQKVRENRESKKTQAEENMDDTEPSSPKSGEKWKALHMNLAASRTKLSLCLP
ncbi:unnamed protein product [Durusdinium trenchii]|uniref:Uncharacterized protein n=1 Tax=Durusdinium trenchii TaxID=1381693 RepID=A0ABP0NKP1_9DINO